MEQPTGISHDALYLVWKLNDTDRDAPGNTKYLLSAGECLNLYRLRSWVITNGEVRALLAPSAPLDQITGAIWDNASAILASRWIAGTRACASVTREIENVPVRLGLAERPEQWSYSSAARLN